MKRRVLFLGFTGVLLIGVLAGAVATALLHPAPDTSAIDNSARVPTVVAEVEQRAARTAASVSGQLRSPVLAAVNPTVATPASGAAGTDGADGAARKDSAAVPAAVLQVVSARIRAAGDTVSPGDLLAEVSGRPVYGFARSAPLYRDLVVGSAGNDVRALQRMLVAVGIFRGEVDGRFRASTLSALKRLYHRDGYRLAAVASGKKGLPLAETARLPGKDLRIAEACPVGRQPTARRPMLQVETQSAVVTARVDLLQAEAFGEGRSVQVQVGSAEPVRSKVLTVSAFKEAGSSTPPGYDITVAVPKGVSAKKSASEPILVSEAGAIPKAPAVPLTAIRQDASGASYVLLAGDGVSRAEGFDRVVVEVVAQVSGYAVLAANDRLPAGTKVVVSGG